MNFQISGRRDRHGIRTNERPLPTKRGLGMIETLLRHGYSTWEIARLTEAGSRFSLPMGEMCGLGGLNEDGTFSIPGCPGYQED